MSKYKVVSFEYDYHTHEYKNEKELVIDGVSTDSLENIDSFFASHTYEEVMALIRQQNNITYDDNTIRIKCITKDNQIYMNPIYDNEILLGVISSLQEIKHSNKKYIDRANPYFKKIVDEIKNIKNQEDLNKILPYDSYLKDCIREYMLANSKDELYTKEFNLLNELSNYKSFRKYLSSKQLLNKKRKADVKKIEVNEEPIIAKEQEEYEKDYVTKYEEENKISYNEDILNAINQRDLDREEFIEEDELEQMGYSGRKL